MSNGVAVFQTMQIVHIKNGFVLTFQYKDQDGNTKVEQIFRDTPDTIADLVRTITNQATYEA